MRKFRKHGKGKTDEEKEHLLMDSDPGEDGVSFKPGRLVAFAEPEEADARPRSYTTPETLDNRGRSPASPSLPGRRRGSTVRVGQLQITMDNDRIREPDLVSISSDHAPLTPTSVEENSLYGSVEALSPAEVRKKINQVSDLICQLEEMANLLKDQLHSAKQSLKPRARVRRQFLPILLRFQILFIIAIQGLSLGIIAIHQAYSKDIQSWVIVTHITTVSFQVLNTSHVLVASVILSRKLLRTGRASGWFLAQTYFCTVLIFAGLYFVIYRFKADCWEFSASDHLEDFGIFGQYTRFLYLSVSTATLCGAANIQPKVWFVVLIVCFQSLVNFVYFASILAQTIGNYRSYTINVQRSESESTAMGSQMVV